MKADKERYDPNDPEAAVDQTPVKRDTPHRPGDEGKGNYAGAGNESELEYPLVADGVDERTNEGDCDYEVGEGEPVCSIGHEGVGPVGLDDAFVNAAEPCVESWLTGSRTDWVDVENAVRGGSLALKGESGDATKNQPNDEENEPDADNAQGSELG